MIKRIQKIIRSWQKEKEYEKNLLNLEKGIHLIIKTSKKLYNYNNILIL